ncbi:unnamed protein product [Orchesella dallaii]|uniref:Estradiol 17-beta-dehydrogenase 2 n=1 Tax=Orchesella dallaii TaxID=48710 RepID=A0ABP1QVR0_9HEXA
MIPLSKFDITNMNITGVVAASALSSYYLYKKISSYNFEEKQKNDRPCRLIVITGCDSGLGFSMAVWAATIGYKVLAGCLNENGEGACKLRNQFPDQVFVTSLNVTDMRSLENFHGLCRQILETNGGKLRLWAIIANAAVCILGEHFWQTPLHREQQMDVNFWGAVNFITEFRSSLFENKARVLVVSSDCSEYPLPFLAPYCASKAAVNGWTQSLRFEVAKYGVHVVSYQPRDFGTKSSLFAHFETHYSQMAEEMSDADKKFYGEYFEKFMDTKKSVFKCTQKAIEVMDSPHHRNSFYYLMERDISGISVYRDFSLAQIVLHRLFNTLPQRYVDRIANFLLNREPKNACWRGSSGQTT